MPPKKTVPIEEALDTKPQAKTGAQAEQERKDAALALFEAGMVIKNNQGFDVFHDNQKQHVSKDGAKTVCTCDDFRGADALGVDASLGGYACTHIWAVRYTEAGTVPEERELTFGGNGEIVDDMTTAQQEFVDRMDEQTTPASVKPGSDIIGRLSAPIPRQLIKQRKANWSPSGFVDYIPWTLTADILDRELKHSWDFTVDKIERLGDSITATATLAVKSEEVGYTARSNVGVCSIVSGKIDMAVKGAVSDALKRCGVLFGIGRELYMDPDPEEIKQDDHSRPANFTPPTEGTAKAVSRATSGGDSASAKQLGMIRAIGRDKGVDVEQIAAEQMNCSLDELTKRSASDLIGYLQGLQTAEEQASSRTTW